MKFKHTKVLGWHSLDSRAQRTHLPDHKEMSCPGQCWVVLPRGWVQPFTSAGPRDTVLPKLLMGVQHLQEPFQSVISLQGSEEQFLSDTRQQLLKGNSRLRV